jgi:hypothetical protein
MGEEHRIKRKQFKFYLDETVYNILNEKAAAAKMNKTNFLAQIIINSNVIVHDQIGIKDLTDAINKIGVNINQIVYHVNAKGGGCTQAELESLLTEFIKISEEVYARAWGI